MASIQLALQDVTVRFPDGVLLENINIEVENGESVVLIGPSGCGKTVLLKLFAGLLKPTSGKVLVNGKDLHALETRERVEVLLTMGMLFQKNALFDSLTVAENIAFPLRESSPMDEIAIQDCVTFFLKAVGLTEARDLYPSEISGGMQKRLGIARALALNPKILLYDDPTAGLDPITSRKIVELIMALRLQNRSTMVSVTNDMTRAYQMADRVVMVVDRELIITGNRKQTLDNKDPRVVQFVRGQLEGPLTVMA